MGDLGAFRTASTGRTGRLLAWLRASFAGRCVLRMFEQRPIDRALALATRAFVAVIPASIVASSISPAARRGGYAEGIVERFGLADEGADAVRTLFATPAEVSGGISALGFLVLIYSVASFARLLARVYQDAWRLPPAGVRTMLRGLVWVAGFAGWVAFILPLRSWLQSRLGHLPGAVALLATGIVLWLWTPWVLLAGRVRLRQLVPTGLLTATAMTVYGALSAVWMPKTMTSSAEQYGLVGIAFSLVSWLIGAGLIVVAAASIGAVAGEGRGGGKAGQGAS